LAASAQGTYRINYIICRNVEIFKRKKKKKKKKKKKPPPFFKEQNFVKEI